MAPQDAMFVWPIITYSVIDTPLLSFVVAALGENFMKSQSGIIGFLGLVFELLSPLQTGFFLIKRSNKKI